MGWLWGGYSERNLAARAKKLHRALRGKERKKEYNGKLQRTCALMSGDQTKQETAGVREEHAENIHSMNHYSICHRIGKGYRDREEWCKELSLWAQNGLCRAALLNTNSRLRSEIRVAAGQGPVAAIWRMMVPTSTPE